ncbi:MAG: sigma-54-dependent Fis family transcriptional regulator [Deltaproteobacteria bacterium]|nr:sigma-54-dependent Fis family transcriptional regulator [Deltaproteobacteria bacterium]
MDTPCRRILVVEDDPGLRFTLTDNLEEAGYAVSSADDGGDAVRLLASETFDIVVTDIRLPGKDGLEVLKEAKSKTPAPSVITITGFGSVESAVAAMKLGAEDYLTKPFSMEEFMLLLNKVLRVRALEEENRDLKKLIASQSRFEELIGKSKPMREVFDLVTLVADTDATVLILGESGTGKELVARAVHRRGKRKDGPFVALNCAAIPETLFEAELFGFEKGAFTGALKRTEGKIEQAGGGTLFLDEIADMPLPAQAKLLRVLQERVITRIGGHENVPVDIRIVTATNKDDLKSMVAEGGFREDLFYRLNVFAIRLPPLRDRLEDVPLLVENFVGKLGGNRSVSESSMSLLMNYGYPGNVRELWNIVERATILCREGTIEPRHLPPEIPDSLNTSSGENSDPRAILPLKEAVRRFELDHIQRALRATGGSKTGASELLGIGRKALWERLKG